MFLSTLIRALPPIRPPVIFENDGRVSAMTFLLQVRVPGPANHCWNPFCLYNPPQVPGIIGFYEHAFPLGSHCFWGVTSRPVATSVRFWQNFASYFCSKSFQELSVIDGSKNKHIGNQAITGYVNCVSASLHNEFCMLEIIVQRWKWSLGRR